MNGMNLTCQMLQKDVQSNQLVISDTTPRIYRKAMLTITVERAVRIIICPLTEFFCTEDSTVGNMGFTAKQSVACHLQVSNNPAIEFLLSTHICRGTWRSWLRHCATSRKVTGPIPNGVTGIFH